MARSWGVHLRRLAHAALACGALATLPGCGVSVSVFQQKPAGPPPTAAVILQRAAHVGATDFSFNATFKGTSNGKPMVGYGSGSMTFKPFRADIVFSGTYNGIQESFEIISDEATKTSYMEVTEPESLYTGKWVRKPDDSLGLHLANTPTPYSDPKNYTLIGPDRVDGPRGLAFQGPPARPERAAR